MRIDDRQLRHLNVTTKSGQALGRVTSVIIETETHLVSYYRVCSMPLVPAFGATYEIARAMVVSISETEMVVDDGVVSVEERRASSEPLIAPTPSAE